MPRTSNPSGLTDKQERFVAEYLVDSIGSAAAVRAGYSERSAQSSAKQLMATPKVRAAINAGKRRLAKKLELSAEKTLGDIDRIARKAERAKDYGQAIRGHELIGKHLRLFSEKVELTGANDGPVEFTEIRRTIVRPQPKP